MSERLSWEDVYQVCSKYTGLDNSNKQIFLDWTNRKKNSKRICRFCNRIEGDMVLWPDGKTKPLTFSSDAHAISHSLGNRRLFSHYECTLCNSLFGRKYEDDFGKYVLPFKMISKVFGKKKNSMKNKMGEHKIIVNKNPTTVNPNLIIDTTNDRHVLFDEDTGEVTITFERQGYKPQNVSKAIIKMALSIMNETDINEDYEDWAYVLASLQLPSEKSFEINKGVLEFMAGDNPFHGTNIALYKRKNNQLTEYPKYRFNISFGNFCIHMPIPIMSEIEKNTLTKIKPTFVESTIVEISFTEIEHSFNCVFNAEQHELSEAQKQDLTEILRQLDL